MQRLVQGNSIMTDWPAIERLRGSLRYVCFWENFVIVRWVGI